MFRGQHVYRWHQIAPRECRGIKGCKELLGVIREHIRGCRRCQGWIGTGRECRYSGASRVSVASGSF